MKNKQTAEEKRWDEWYHRHIEEVYRPLCEVIAEIQATTDAPKPTCPVPRAQEYLKP